MDHICIAYFDISLTLLGAGGEDSTPYLRFLLVKILLIDIFTIPSVRIPEILLAIRK